jgi:excisionase family DNA binding protein
MVIEGTLLSAQEVASQLRVSDRAVLDMIYRDDFPNAFKAGRAWRIPESDLEEYVEKQRRERRAAASTSES